MSGIKKLLEEMSEKNYSLGDYVLNNNESSTNSCYCKGPQNGESKCPCQLKKENEYNKSVNASNS